MRYKLVLFRNKIEAAVSETCPSNFETSVTIVPALSLIIASHMEETAVGALARVCASEDGHILAAPEGTAFKSIASVDTSADTTQGDESSTPNSFQQPDTLTASIREAFEGKRCASLDDFHLLATIGRANFAKMFLAKAKVSQSLYVLRATRKDLIIESKEVGHIKEERDALLIAAKERHPFIVQVESTFQTETRLYTVLEYLGGGDLMYHIQKGTPHLMRTASTLFFSTAKTFVKVIQCCPRLCLEQDLVEIF